MENTMPTWEEKPSSTSRLNQHYRKLVLVWSFHISRTQKDHRRLQKICFFEVLIKWFRAARYLIIIKKNINRLPIKNHLKVWIFLVSIFSHFCVRLRIFKTNLQRSEYYSKTISCSRGKACNIAYSDSLTGTQWVK